VAKKKKLLLLLKLRLLKLLLRLPLLLKRLPLTLPPCLLTLPLRPLTLLPRLLLTLLPRLRVIPTPPPSNSGSLVIKAGRKTGFFYACLPVTNRRMRLTASARTGNGRV
jgi:hypothetical protein